MARGPTRHSPYQHHDAELGTWTLTFSLYTMEDIQLPLGSFRANEPLLVRFTRVADVQGPFTLYTVATY